MDVVSGYRMSNTETKGKITINGVAIRGLTVIVYDQEYLLGLRIHSQELKSTTTDSNGNYSVSYSPDDYGGFVTDEDRVQTSPGRLWPPRWPTYAAANPDLYIEVYQGNTRLKTSEIKKDEESDTCIIDLDIEQDPQGERDWGETLGDWLVDGANTIMDGGARVVEQAGELLGNGLDNVFGEGSGDSVRAGSSRLAEAIRNLGNNKSNDWADKTNRTRPIPEDLWESMRDRYRNYKRDLLLRHFFIDRTNQHHSTERAIPFLISQRSVIGKIDTNRAPTCDGNGRYNAAEQHPLTSLMKTDENEEWTNEQWREHLRKNGDKYARVYENGLAYNGSFIACLAHEYALADASNSLSSSTSSEDYKYECEALITLALDAIEDLQNRTEVPGYIIRYHEDGDCSAYERIDKDNKLCDDFSFETCSEGGVISSDLVHAKLLECGIIDFTETPQLKERKEDSFISWLVFYDETNVLMLIKDENNMLNVNVNVYECEKIFCGFKDTEKYCKILSGDRPEHETSNDWEKEKRQRRYEPSGDEYIHLLEGLVTTYNILPEESENHDRIKSLISNIHTYLVEHYYYLIRPCGNFTARGPYMSTYEFPLSCMFKDILGVDQSNSSTASILEVLKKALIVDLPFDVNEDVIMPSTSIHGIHIDPSEDVSFMTDLLILHKLPPEIRWPFVYYSLARLNIDPNALIRVFPRLRSLIQEEFSPISALKGWTLEMLAKASLIGESGVSSIENQAYFQEIYDDWFLNVGDRRVSAGYSYSPTTLATAVALLGKKTPTIWNKLNFFFHREQGISKNIENETRDHVSEPMYPMDHIELELKFNKERNGVTGKEQAGEDSLFHAMWPCATIAHSLGKPLDAAISDFIEEDGMPANSAIKNMLDTAIANRQN